MSVPLASEASIPNPALEPFSALIGRWDVQGKHRLMQDTVLHGRSSFEWVENGAFLMWRSAVDEPGIPSALAIIGSDDRQHEFFMLYFDERGVSRMFQVTLQDDIWAMWRNAPGFSQRYTGLIEDGGNTIRAQWDLSEDGLTWEKDIELVYRRAA